MKNIYLATVLLAGLGVTGLSSCMLNCVHGSGNQKTENRKVDDFNRIEISGGFKVVLKQGSSLNVKITADDNLFRYIKTNISGGRLHIYSKRSFCVNDETTLVIGVRDLEAVRASGAVEIQADGKFKAKDLAFHLSGATKVNMELSAANVRAEGSGATELYLTGQASSLDVDMSGSGKVHALDFVVGNCRIQTSGIGESEVNVLNTLDISSSGASSVRYKGHPSIHNDKSGASSVEQVN